ncbi:unnamed protein product [Discosporangium mesarthrocarpum]
MNVRVPPGVAYTLVSATRALTIVGMGELLIEVAENVGSTSIEIADAFLGRGAGQIIAVASSLWLFRTLNGDTLMSVFLVINGIMWLWLPYIVTVRSLYLWFFMSGLVITIVDIGTLIMVKRVYNHKAGPWLMATTAGFSGLASLAPLVSYIGDGSVLHVTMVFGLYNFGCVVVMALQAKDLQHKRTDRAGPGETSSGTALTPTHGAVLSGAQGLFREKLGLGGMTFSKHNIDFEYEMSQTDNCEEVGTDLSQTQESKTAETTRVTGSDGLCKFCVEVGKGSYASEFLMTVMLLMAAGSQTSVTSYICTFLEETEGVVGVERCPLMLSVFWVCMTLSRLLFIPFQVYLSQVFVSIIAMCFGGALGPSPLLFGAWVGQWEAWQVWAGFLLWGTFCGPLPGFIFDLGNRICHNTEEGVILFVIGLNIGSSIVPVITARAWKQGLGPAALPIIMSLCALLMMAVVACLSLPRR